MSKVSSFIEEVKKGPVIVFGGLRIYSTGLPWDQVLENFPASKSIREPTGDTDLNGETILKKEGSRCLIHDCRTSFASGTLRSGGEERTFDVPFYIEKIT